MKHAPRLTDGHSYLFIIFTRVDECGQQLRLPPRAFCCRLKRLARAIFAVDAIKTGDAAGDVSINKVIHVSKSGDSGAVTAVKSIIESSLSND
jgi:hypothetical protein